MTIYRIKAKKPLPARLPVDRVGRDTSFDNDKHLISILMIRTLTLAWGRAGIFTIVFRRGLYKNMPEYPSALLGG